MVLSRKVQVQTHHKYGFPCKGLFAVEEIKEGEMVWEYDTDNELLRTYTRAQILAAPQTEQEVLIMYSYMLDDDWYGSTPSPEEDPSYYFNHSCGPNSWYSGDNLIVARRDIAAGEHVCYDYAFTETESSMHFGLQCRCGSAGCRKTLDFSQYRSPRFMSEYKGHTTDFVARKHAENGWVDGRAQLRHKHEGEGLGLFASGGGFKAGEKVLVFSGKVVHKEQLLEAGAISQREYELSLQVAEDLWQIPAIKRTGDTKETGDFINHCCDANCGMLDSVTVVTLRDIPAEQELTIDYATVNSGFMQQPSDNFDCTCGASECRGKVTSGDWRNPKVQAKYWPHFSPFVRTMIEQLVAAKQPSGSSSDDNALPEELAFLAKQRHSGAKRIPSAAHHNHRVAALAAEAGGDESTTVGSLSDEEVELGTSPGARSAVL